MSVGVRYLDLHAQYLSIQSELRSAIDDVFASSAFVLGPAVERFETNFAAFCENEHCVGISNGTAALHVALLAAGIGPGDEVITQANTFIATVAAILYTGARAVLVDVAPPSLTIDVAAVERAIGPRTKAVVPVHLFGQPCDLGAIRTLAGIHGVRVIEDASQAHGAIYQDETIGSGDVATFSFYPGKNLGAAGEGGAIVTGDAALARTARLLRNHGSESKYVHSMLGYNYRLEGVQGAILDVKLRHLPAWTQARRRIAQRYDRLLAHVERPARIDATESAYHIYPVLVDNRDAVAAALARRGIETNVHYPVPCHLQPGFTGLGYRAGDFPFAERLAQRELSLPIYPELSDESVRYVAETLQAELENLACNPS